MTTRPDAFPDSFVEKAIESGMREVFCEAHGCGKWFLTRRQSVTPDLCPPCLDKKAEIQRLVLNFFEGDTKKSEHWFKTINPLLGGIQPCVMINLGQIERLLKFIKYQLSENEPADVTCDGCGRKIDYPYDVAKAVKESGGQVRCETCGPPPEPTSS